RPIPSAETHAVDGRQIVTDHLPSIAAIFRDVKVACRATKGEYILARVERMAVDYVECFLREPCTQLSPSLPAVLCPRDEERAIYRRAFVIGLTRDEPSGASTARIHRYREPNVHAYLGLAYLHPSLCAVAAIENATVILLPNVLGSARAKGHKMWIVTPLGRRIRQIVVLHATISSAPCFPSVTCFQHARRRHGHHDVRWVFRIDLNGVNAGGELARFRRGRPKPMRLPRALR